MVAVPAPTDSTQANTPRPAVASPLLFGQSSRIEVAPIRLSPITTVPEVLAPSAGSDTVPSPWLATLPALVLAVWPNHFSLRPCNSPGLTPSARPSRPSPSTNVGNGISDHLQHGPRNLRVAPIRRVRVRGQHVARGHRRLPEPPVRVHEGAPQRLGHLAQQR